MQSDTVYVDDIHVSCQGSNAASGHPLIYLNIVAKGELDCPYCGRHFVLKQQENTSAGQH